MVVGIYWVRYNDGVLRYMEATKMLVLTNGTLIDGKGFELIQKATVVIKDNHVEHVELRCSG